MEIVLGVDFDDGGAPILGDRTAVLDEVWVGFEGLTAVLEVRLGLLRLDPPRQGERAAHLAKILGNITDETPWHRSAERDPLATARAVLRLKDAMVLAGVHDDVDPATLPPRLSAVQRFARGLLPGAPQRALAVAEALEAGCDARVSSVSVVDDLAVFPRVLRRIVTALSAQGTKVERRPELAPEKDGGADNDLAAARSDGAASFVGDGSLLLLRTDTVDEAADDVAAFVAGRADVTVIGADVVLDEAFARRGASTVGARGDVGTDALLSMLPLVLALGESSVDPQRLFEAACLPQSPFPLGLASRLRARLPDAPSVISPRVLEAVDAAIASRTEKSAEAGAQLRRRLAALVPAWGPHLSEEALPVNDGDVIVVERLRKRAIALQQLHFGRHRLDSAQNGAGVDADKDIDIERSIYRSALRQLSAFLKLLDRLDQPALTRPQLNRLVRTATSSTRAAPTWPAESGITTVTRPGALCRPAHTVVWWGFTRESGRLPPRTFLTDERQRLVAAGFDPGCATAIAAGHAASSRRPLLAATERLILVAPRRGATGREHHPHPLWDEILAKVPSDERAAAAGSIVRPQEGAHGLSVREAPRRRRTPRGQRLFIIPPGSVEPREVTSPSREEVFLACPLKFTLDERGAKARPRRLKDRVTLEGDVVHAVIKAVLENVSVLGDADAVAAFARSAADDVVKVTAGDWLRPGREQVHFRVREQAARAAVALVQLLREHQLSIHQIETEVEKELPTAWQGIQRTRTLKGTPDLVVVGVDDDGRSFPFVIDHKTGREDHRRQLLRLGVPLQLLDYARLVGSTDLGPPGFGYFIIRSRRLLTSDTRIGTAERIESDRTPREGWAMVERTRQLAFSRLAAGEVSAPGADGHTAKDVDVDVNQGVVVLAPPCSWCRADTICGRAWSVTDG
jgi:hypothetical protein